MAKKPYYLSIARASANVSRKDLEYSMEMLGAHRDEEHGTAWVIPSVESMGVLFSVIQARLGTRYHYALTQRPGERDTVFPYRRCDNSFAKRLKNNSGDLPAAQWEILQGWFEETMETRENALETHAAEATRQSGKKEAVFVPMRPPAAQLQAAS